MISGLGKLAQRYKDAQAMLLVGKTALGRGLGDRPVIRSRGFNELHPDRRRDFRDRNRSNHPLVR